MAADTARTVALSYARAKISLGFAGMSPSDPRRFLVDTGSEESAGVAAATLRPIGGTQVVVPVSQATDGRKFRISIELDAEAQRELDPPVYLAAATRNPSRGPGRDWRQRAFDDRFGGAA